MKKVFNILLIITCCLVFAPKVEAEELWSSLNEDTSFIDDMISGNTVNSTNLNNFINNYDIFYKYAKIEDDNLYKKYISYIVNNENNNSKKEVNNLIPEVQTISDLSTWIKSDGSGFVFENLEYIDGEGKGYLVAVAAIPKTDTSKIYVTRDVYETISSTKLVKSYDLHYADEIEETVNTEENPETGISDYAIYLVPICLVLGTTLMFRKSYI